MKSLYDYVFEHFVTVLPTDALNDKLKYAKQVWEILDNAYKYIGGLAGCKSYDDFLNEYVNNDKDNMLWKLVRHGTTITAVKIYKMKQNHRKSIAMGCIPTDQGKHDINMILNEDMKLKERGVWSESSGKALGTYLNKGYIILPNCVAPYLLPDKEIELLPDGYFYRRIIDGKIHIKMIVGYPPTDIEGQQPTLEQIKKLKDLSKKYEAEQ